jgi:hypothetical protein
LGVEAVNETVDTVARPAALAAARAAARSRRVGLAAAGCAAGGCHDLAPPCPSCPAAMDEAAALGCCPCFAAPPAEGPDSSAPPSSLPPTAVVLPALLPPVEAGAWAGRAAGVASGGVPGVASGAVPEAAAACEAVRAAARSCRCGAQACSWQAVWQPHLRGCCWTGHSWRDASSTCTQAAAHSAVTLHVCGGRAWGARSPAPDSSCGRGRGFEDFRSFQFLL